MSSNNQNRSVTACFRAPLCPSEQSYEGLVVRPLITLVHHQKSSMAFLYLDAAGQFLTRLLQLWRYLVILCDCGENRGRGRSGQGEETRRIATSGSLCIQSQDRVKSRSPQNISGASKQNGVAVICKTTEKKLLKSLHTACSTKTKSFHCSS